MLSMPLKLPQQARYMIRFLESAIDFVGAAATATGPGWNWMDLGKTYIGKPW